MNRDDIIRMAREADIDWHKHWDDEENRLERFAALVAAATLAQQAEPVQRKPLTEEEIDHAANNIFTDDPVQWWRKLARAIEQAHGIKAVK